MNMISVSSSVQIGMFHLPFVNPQCSALGYPVEKSFSYSCLRLFMRPD